MLRSASAFALLCLLSSDVYGQEPGIHPLMEQSLQEALRTEKVDLEAYAPDLVRLKSMSLKEQMALFGPHGPEHERHHYRVILETPYFRAANAAAEAKRRYLPKPMLTLDQVQNDVVIVRALSSGSWSTLASVENVIVKKDGVAIQPIARDVTPHEYHNAMNASRIVNEGTFSFPIDMFAPTSDLTIVVIGEADNMEIPLTVELLKKFR